MNIVGVEALVLLKIELQIDRVESNRLLEVDGKMPFHPDIPESVTSQIHPGDVLEVFCVSAQPTKTHGLVVQIKAWRNGASTGQVIYTASKRWEEILRKKFPG